MRKKAVVKKFATVFYGTYVKLNYLEVLNEWNF